MTDTNEIDESKFDYTYVPEHLKERVKNCRELSVAERMTLVSELSLAAWEKLGVVYDPNKPRNKTIRRVKPDESVLRLSPDKVERIIGFLGYGNVSAKTWFIGLEEGLGKMTTDDTFLNLCSRGDFNEVMDLSDAHRRLLENGRPIEIEKKPPSTQVWRWMARIMLASSGNEDWRDPIAAKNYVRLVLGRTNGETFLTELSPIPSKTAADRPLLRWLAEMTPTLEDKLAKRRKHLRELMSMSPASMVVCYGLGRAADFAEFLEIDWEPVNEKIRRSHDGRCWLLPFFGLGRMSNSVVEELQGYWSSER